MAKISPVSIKYMIHAVFTAEGALEKPDIIGAIFGQTEGLLGADLEMRELQKEGKIGRIEVDVERSDKKTTGKILIPTALDQSETTLIAAAIETIERIGPCDSQIDVEKIEDVRGSKRDYIVDRAKKLMQGLQSTSSKEISKEIQESVKMSEIQEYGKSKLPCGDISDKELIVVEGRADVINLLKNGVKNVIAMSGTKLPDEIKKLGDEKDIVLFVDGDRGGKLIAQNVVDNVKVKSICVAPEGKEVEELVGKEILMQLRKRFSPKEFFRNYNWKFGGNNYKRENQETSAEVNDSEKDKLKVISKEIQGSGKAVVLDGEFNEIANVSARALAKSLKSKDDAKFLVIDGTVTNAMINSAEEANVKAIAGSNFATADTKIKLLSL